VVGQAGIVLNLNDKAIRIHVKWNLNWYLESLRSKRFRGVWEQRKTRNGIFGVLPARKMGREPKTKDGGGGRQTTGF